MTKRNYRVEERRLVIDGTLRSVKVKVYRPIRVPDAPLMALPRCIHGFRDSTVGLGGNFPMGHRSLVMSELGLIGSSIEEGGHR